MSKSQQSKVYGMPVLVRHIVYAWYVWRSNLSVKWLRKTGYIPWRMAWKATTDAAIQGRGYPIEVWRRWI